MLSALWLAAALLAPAARAADHPTLALGSPAPDFRLPGVDGKEHALADFAAAKVLVVAFTCNHCPTAQAYEERLMRLVAEYGPRGVAFVGINPNHAPAVRLDELGFSDLGDTLKEMKVRAEHKGYNFPYLDDGPTEAVSEKYGPVATPHIFVFDAARKLRFQGRIDDSERESDVKHSDTRAAIDALLAGQEPAVAKTKVFGCSVKWKEKVAGNLEWLAKVAKEPVALAPADAAALAELRANKSGKVRVVNFWATWCGPCVAEFDELIDTNLSFRNRDFEMVTVAAEHPDQTAKVKAFLEKHHASTRNLIYADADKYKMLEAFDPEWNGALPYTVVIGADGKILYRESGSLDFLKLRRVVVPALNAITPWPGLSGPG
ncbi:MAG: redoxin domain-containing protein [Opitutaceae bacterium]|nr:redoxin domain-containing protein [Opitutaceae bacterium]